MRAHMISPTHNMHLFPCVWLDGLRIDRIRRRVQMQEVTLLNELHERHQTHIHVIIQCVDEPSDPWQRPDLWHIPQCVLLAHRDEWLKHSADLMGAVHCRLYLLNVCCNRAIAIRRHLTLCIQPSQHFVLLQLDFRHSVRLLLHRPLFKQRKQILEGCCAIFTT